MRAAFTAPVVGAGVRFMYMDAACLASLRRPSSYSSSRRNPEYPNVAAKFRVTG